MWRARARCLLLGLAFSLMSESLAAADTVLLDDQDCVDWARVFDASVWKQKGSALGGRSLLKFDLTDLGPVQAVDEATLRLFIERGQAGVVLKVYHVHDDGWSYHGTGTADLYTWPRDELIAALDASDTASVAVDVTTYVEEEFASGSAEFTIKLESVPNHSGVRVASPLAPRWHQAPSLRVTFQPGAAPPPFADLALSSSDIRFGVMQPNPGDDVQVVARIRNNASMGSVETTVAFWDGVPNASQVGLIGSVQVPPLGPGGDAVEVQISLSNVQLGLHSIYVVVDPDDVVTESNETNNVAFCSYRVADEYDHVFESFEYGGQNDFYGDFDFPPQFGLPVPKPAFLGRSGAAPCHGEYGLEAILDGTADDGTVWIERALPVEPGRRYRVELTWRDFRYHSDIAFVPVAAIDVLDPEMEADFTFLSLPADGGCWLVSFEEIVESGQYDHVWVACGYSITWETAGMLGIDSVAVEVQELAGTGVVTSIPPAAPVAVGRPVPNPSMSGAEVVVSLREKTLLDIAVYDVHGRLVRRLLGGRDGPGDRRLRWDGRTTSGRPAPQGVYFLAVRANGQKLAEQRVVIVR